ncbi:Transporter OS=Streptomyces fumanus OX=67302 GN=GCM10018772_35650 PE=4 SV=1 [Streptomyces fumanus]
MSERPEPRSTDDAGGDRSARRAVTVFPVLVLLAGALGLLLPDGFAGWGEAVPYLLGVVMFCMGVTMTPRDFRGVAQRLWAVALGLVAHYVIMPGLGWAIAHLLSLPPQLAARVSWWAARPAARRPTW